MNNAEELSADCIPKASEIFAKYAKLHQDLGHLDRAKRNRELAAKINAFTTRGLPHVEALHLLEWPSANELVYLLNLA